MTDASAAPAPTLTEYLRAEMTPRFAALVQAATRKVAAAQGELDDLRAATGTIAWEVIGPSPAMCYVNIGNGEMTVSQQPASDPLMTVSLTAEDWQRFTSGMSGLFAGDPRRPLGRSRLDRIRSLQGAVRFVLTGLPDGGSWSCTLSFGAGPRPAEPQTTVSLPADAVGKIQAGQLDPQVAFMQGMVKLSGDPGLAMRLGMAMFL